MFTVPSHRKETASICANNTEYNNTRSFSALMHSLNSQNSQIKQLVVRKKGQYVYICLYQIFKIIYITKKSLLRKEKRVKKKVVKSVCFLLIVIKTHKNSKMSTKRIVLQ